MWSTIQKTPPPERGKVPFGRELYIERDDFRRIRRPSFLPLGSRSRGEAAERLLHQVRGCNQGRRRRGRGVALHLRSRNAGRRRSRWTKGEGHAALGAAAQAIEAEARLYDHLFLKPDPDDVEPGQSFVDNLNPDSLTVSKCMVEPSVIGAQPGTTYQFERLGYFCVDPDSTEGKLVFNRTATLRDTWAKIAKPERSRQSDGQGRFKLFKLFKLFKVFQIVERG